MLTLAQVNRINRAIASCQLSKSRMPVIEGLLVEASKPFGGENNIQFYPARALLGDVGKTGCLRLRSHETPFAGEGERGADPYGITVFTNRREKSGLNVD